MGIFNDDYHYGGNWVDTAIKLAPTALPIIGDLLKRIIPERKAPAPPALPAPPTLSDKRTEMILKMIEETEDPKLRLEYLKLLPK